MAKYKLVKSLYEDSISCIKDTETGDVIPIDSSNTEYQNYQSSPIQKKKRASRNAARAKFIRTGMAKKEMVKMLCIEMEIH